MERMTRDAMVSVCVYGCLSSNSYFSCSQDPELRHKARLVMDDELPSWLIKDVEEVEQMAYEENEERIFGLGKRQRKEVDYSEALTERQWLKALEDGNIEQAEEAKKQRKRRRKDVVDEPPSKVSLSLSLSLSLSHVCML